MKALCFLFITGCLVSLGACNAFKYETKTIEILVDHFSFINNKTFSLRYLVNDSFVQDKKSPILFYTGNEGDIELFAENTGFMWRAAEELAGSLVFAEHRYYGKSMPFGNDSYKDPQHLGYLTSEQALADFADLLMKINSDGQRPVIVFGGSYGGMLAAYFRMKYPHLVTGALASSAPVMQFPGIVPCDIFNRILTSVFKVSLDRKADGSSNTLCVDNIKKFWDVSKNFSSTDNGRKVLNTKFKFCNSSMISKPEDWKPFYSYLQDVMGNLAMANYPYPANFLAELPAYPVREFCGQINKVPNNDDELLSAFNDALQVYTNFTGKTQCIDTSTAYDSSLGSLGWEFQACTEMVMPMCSLGGTDMFIPEKWDFKQYSNDCYKKFGIFPRETFAISQYGAQKLDTLSNIIFSNGLLDPWSGGGVLRTFSDKIDVVLIPEGAHHLDLRSSNPLDPASVKMARKFHMKRFREWISAYATKYNY